MTYYQPSAAKALAGAIAAARQPEGRVQREQFSGRVDRTRLCRVALGDRRVFQRASQPAPRRLRVFILLDASGSMRGTNADVATQTARNLADATELLPNITAEVWAHTTEGDDQVRVFKLWVSGQPRERINRYDNITKSANMDGAAIAYVGEKLRDGLKVGERGLLIVVSDGKPVYTKSFGEAELAGDGFMDLWGGKASFNKLVDENLVPTLKTLSPWNRCKSRDEIVAKLRDTAREVAKGKHTWSIALSLSETSGAVKALRRQGIAVLSVAVAGTMSFEDQVALYGKGAAIPYHSEPRVLAKAMATAIGRNVG